MKGLGLVANTVEFCFRDADYQSTVTATFNYAIQEWKIVFRTVKMSVGKSESVDTEVRVPIMLTNYVVNIEAAVFVIARAIKNDDLPFLLMGVRAGANNYYY